MIDLGKDEFDKREEQWNTNDEMLLEKYSQRYQPGAGVNFGEYYRAEMRRLGLESGITLSWRNLTYTVMQTPQTKQGTMLNNLKSMLQFWKRPKPVAYHLLNHVSGYIKPGMLTLLLGPPGAGKTTLMEVLAGRKQITPTSKMSGEVLINGDGWTPDFNRIAGYVAQDDYHIPLMTVRETLTFSSNLRNHPYVTAEKRDERVDVVLDVLGISHVAETVVGGELLRGVSGGERKRVSIGVELVSCPAVLFMDEPTTGLDSSASYDIMKSLRFVADAGIPVVVSLLQPSQELFNLFDSLILMDKRECAYFGPTNKCVEHFEQAGYTCPKNKNVAEFLLDICTVEEQQYRNAHKVPGQSLADYYRTSEISAELGRTLWAGLKPPEPERTVLPSRRIFAVDVGTQIKLCTKRNASIFFRNRRAVIVRLLRSLIIGLLIGSLFWDMDTTQLGGNNRISLVFFCITFTAMGSIASLPQVSEERRIFYHQRAAHFYRTIAHFIASLVMDIPLSFLEGIIFSSLVFWMTGMNDGSWYDQIIQFLMFGFVLLMTNLVAKQFCRFCAAATPTLGFASALAPAILCIWLVFAGFLIPRTTIPVYWKPLNVLSPFRYTLESLSVNTLSDLSIQCAPNEMVPPPSKMPPQFCTEIGLNPDCTCSFDDATCPSDELTICGCEQVCPTPSGVAILEQYGLNTKDGYVYLDAVMLVLFYTGFCLLTFFALEFFEWTSSGGSGPKTKEDEEAALAAHRNKQEGNIIEYMRDEEDYNLSGVVGDSNGIPLYSEVEASNMGASLVFSHLNYSVNIAAGLDKIKGKKKWKQLLFDVMGYAPAGRMIALMGATGAGKTTLLDVLAQRKTGGKMEGDIIVNGNFKDHYYNRLVGYVEQSNVFLPTLTVRETLQYSALMRLRATIPHTEKLRRVEETIDQLHLRDVADRMVGMPETGGLSMELRKKLSIAVELVAEPAIFFLDEPTSGLDSQAAASVMETARIVANTGVPVICTIHQPSAALFYLFDWLLLLRPGGQTIYFGPLGEKARTVLDFFRRHGLHCSEEKNPADFVLECSGAGIGPREDDPSVGFAIPEDFDCDATWLNSTEFQALVEKMDEMTNEAEMNKTETKRSGASPTGYNSPYSVSLPRQIALSVKRSFMNKYRQPTVIRSFFLMYFVMGLILGTLYFQLDTFQTGARNRVALIYFCIVFCALGAITSIPGIILQRAVYYREKPSFLRPFAYFLAQILAEIPLVLITVSVFGSMVYLMCMTNSGFDHPGGHYLFFLAVYVMAAFSCTFYAMAVASCVATTEVANTIVGVSTSMFSLFAGFIIPKESIPPYWRWLHYLSYYKYPLEALSINQMVGLTFECQEDEYVYVRVGQTFMTYCPIQSGTDFLANHFTMNTTYEYAGLDVAAIGLFSLFFIAITFLGIRFINHLKR